MDRIIIILQLISYLFVLVPDSHFVDPLFLYALDQPEYRHEVIYFWLVLLGLVGIIWTIIFFKSKQARWVNLAASIMVLFPISKFIDWHDWFIPFCTAIPFVLISIFNFWKVFRYSQKIGDKKSA